jgi:hypothetical protein
VAKRVRAVMRQREPHRDDAFGDQVVDRTALVSGARGAFKPNNICKCGVRGCTSR